MGAIALSLLLHAAILYVPPLALLFSVTPLGWGEWRAVVALSAPVVALDEGLKLVSRQASSQHGIRVYGPRISGRSSYVVALDKA